MTEPSIEKSPRSLDQALRPTEWADYIGQPSIKENLRILLTAAKGRNHQPEHVLLYGPPGLGKTTLSHLIAKELGANLRTTSGPAVERVGDLASILTNLTPGDVLFIDEIHRLNRTIEEVLYPAMEAGVLDIVIGKGPSARTVQLELPPFTLIAATTRISLLSAPLRSRFSGGTFRLQYYSVEEIAEILRRSAKILGIDIDKDSLMEISRRSRATPRTANYLLKRARDFAEVNSEKLDIKTVKKALALLEIDEIGLNQIDRDILTILVEKFNGGPVGLKTIAASLSEEEATIEEVHEPYLMQVGLLERTPRGRIVTKKGYEHIGAEPPKGQTQLL
ncbi:MAG: Holliday junction branch migration DNA helicase RuvB [Candidatus Kaiserbacteria bacterium]|nr:Holliday junction branch migration DNA helicase RuvB [Candidatus Kaiserbacteria bacterium]